MIFDDKMVEEEKRVNLLPKGLKNFVDKAFDLIKLNEFYEDYKRSGGPLDGLHHHYAVIKWFLALKIDFDKSKVPLEYQNINYVHDLPKQDILNCLFYINYSLGTTPHTGGQDYCKLYERLLLSIK